MFHSPIPATVDNPIVKVLAFIQDGRHKIVIQWGYWQYRKHGSLQVQGVPYIGYFSGHFFSRYRERIWKTVRCHIKNYYVGISLEMS